MSQTTPVPPLIPGDAYFSDVQTDQPIVTKSSVTQLTSLATPVTINAACGTIVTVAAGVIAAAGTATITVNNSFCASAGAASPYSSVVLATVNGYTGTGTPVVASCVPTSTGFNLVIANVGAAGTNAAITVAFLVC